MNVETLVAAALIAAAIFAIRKGHRQIAGVWQDATRVERCVLVLAAIPNPLPGNGVVGALVVARILRRRHGRR